MKEGGILLCCGYHWSQWIGQEGRYRERGGGGKRGQNTWDKPAGFGSTQGRSEMAGEGKSLVWSRSLARQRAKGWSEDGRLIWIGSSRPNVSAGSQHA